MTPNWPRQSTETKIVSVWTGILTLVVGVALMAFGGWFLWQEMQHPPSHSTHIYLFSAIAILGALVIRPDPIFGAVTKVFVILGDTNLPLVGGRRKTDLTANGDPKPPEAPKP